MPISADPTTPKTAAKHPVFSPCYNLVFSTYPHHPTLTEPPKLPLT
jgi:hypothetical protein